MKTQGLIKAGPRKSDAALEDIEAVYFDIDNTLVPNEASDLPTDRFIRAAEAAEPIVRLAFASARFLPKVKHIMDGTGANGFSILGNGAQIFDGEKKEIVAEWPISSGAAREIVGQFEGMQIRHWINDDGLDYFPSKKGDETFYRKQFDMWNLESDLYPESECSFEKPFLIVARMITEDQVKEVRKFVETFKDEDIASLIAHEWKNPDGNFLYDMLILHRLANKRHAFHAALEMQGLSSSQAMMVGDGRNDEVIVAVAGIGVAMGNAAEETLRVATHVVPRREEDGAAVVLEHLIAAKKGHGSKQS